MNKISIVIFLVIMLSMTGCRSKSEELVPGTVLEGFAQTTVEDTEEIIVDERDSAQLRFLDNCDFISVSDVKDICGTDVEMIQLNETMYGPCTFRFDNGESHYLRFIYNKYAPEDNKERGYNYCLTGQKGEEVTEFVCATLDDKNVYIFGDYYAISLGEEYDYQINKVCTFDQIKELGSFLKEKIYS